MVEALQQMESNLRTIQNTYVLLSVLTIIVIIATIFQIIMLIRIGIRVDMMYSHWYQRRLYGDKRNPGMARDSSD